MTSSASISLPFLALLLIPACQDPGDDTGWTPDERSCQLEGGVSMISLSAGSFTMGSPVEEGTAIEDEEQHEVILTTPFAIGKYEVMQEQYQTCLKHNPSEFSSSYQAPVESLTWHHAAAFANALSRGEGLTPCYDCLDREGEGLCETSVQPYLCEGYRLPTEAEWEYAARAGTTTAFATGGDMDDSEEYECHGNWYLDNDSSLGQFAWYCNNNSSTTHAAGELDENAWGMHDVSGNVWEWCHDGYQAYDGDVTDPLGPESDPRVIRGGAFDDAPVNVRSATRGAQDADHTRATLGFRLARSVFDN